MTDPDEYANNVDNGGFTMPLIADTLTNTNYFRSLFGMPTNATFNEQAANIYISRDAGAGIIDEYTGMNGSIAVKQADVVLDTFPLNYQNNYTAKDSLNDLEYYAGKQSLAGPGMTYAIFSIVASQVATSGCVSYTYQQYSEHPYARGPWFQFSEQLTDDYTTNGKLHLSLYSGIDDSYSDRRNPPSISIFDWTWRSESSNLVWLPRSSAYT